MPKGWGTILGGLPVVADVSFGYDSFTGEGYAEVQEIYWCKRGSTSPELHGKALPRHLFDKALEYDPYFSCLIEEVQDYLIHRDLPDREPVQLRN